MPDPVAAAWVALGVGIGAFVMIGVACLLLVRQWRRTNRTRAAAGALVDVHRARLDDSMDAIATRAADVGEHGEALMESVAALRSDIDHLMWLGKQIPEARDSFQAALLDIVLPTSSNREGARDERARS